MPVRLRDAVPSSHQAPRPGTAVEAGAQGKEVNSSLYGESLSTVERKKRKPVSLRRVSALKKLLIKSVSPSYQVYNERARLHRLAERSNHLN